MLYRETKDCSLDVVPVSVISGAVQSPQLQREKVQRPQNLSATLDR